MKKSNYSIYGYRGYKVSLKLVRERANSYDPVFIRNPGDVFEFLKDTLGISDKERAVSILLDNKNKVIGVDEVSIGTINSTIFHPREIFKAVLLSNAVNFIICHNHPSGNPEPSPEDIQVSERIKKAAEVMGISLLDHIIIGNVSFVSLKDKGYL